MDLIEQIRELGDQAFRKARFDLDFRNQLIAATPELVGDYPYNQRIYHLLNPDKIPAACALDKLPTFLSLQRGYALFCARDKSCICKSQKHSETMKQKRANETEEQRVNQREKTIQTNQTTYGVRWASQAESVKQKICETNFKKYGKKTASQTEEVKEKTKRILFEKYEHGHWTRTNAGKVILRRNTMKSARDAYTQKTGYSNPFKDPEVKTKIKMHYLKLSNNNNVHCQQIQTIRQKTKNTFLKKYGVASVGNLSTSKTRQISRKKYYGDDLYQLLTNNDYVIAASQTLSPTTFASNHNVSYSTAYRLYKKLNLTIPKSLEQNEIAEFIRSLDVNIICNSRSIIPPKEIDIFIPELNLGIEYCGLAWHSELLGAELGSPKPNDYHLQKHLLCQNKNIRLITIFSDEWIYKKDIVKSRLISLLGKNKDGVYARKCVVSKVSWKTSKTFLDQHHIQGSGSPTNYNYGLFFENMLIALMTFRSPRIIYNGNSNKNMMELVRFVSDGRNHPGAASKLFNSFSKEHNIGVFSFADRRWSDGNLYKTLGFGLIGTSKPNYWYTMDHKLREYRFKYRKDKLVANGAEPSLSEWEIMKQMGYDRIWDCGSMKFLKK